jgi:hypothetical protein
VTARERRSEAPSTSVLITYYTYISENILILPTYISENIVLAICFGLSSAESCNVKPISFLNGDIMTSICFGSKPSAQSVLVQLVFTLYIGYKVATYWPGQYAHFLSLLLSRLGRDFLKN